MRKILLTGKNGQVGWELQRALAPMGEVMAVGKQEMDLADPDSIRRVIRELRPSIIVNAAAYTAVDKAESEPDLAMAINGIAPGIMAEEAGRLKAAIVHYSTDYVFDGTKKAPYSEEDAPNPLNVYGKTKLAGERAVQAVGASHLILRTSWVYGLRGKNFLMTMLRLSKEKDKMKVVNDQQGAPMWSRMLAEMTTHLLAPHFYSPSGHVADALAGLSGLYHATSGGKTTWYGFAKKTFELHSRMTGNPMPGLIPITTADYPLPAIRPRNSCLSGEKLLNTCGMAMPSWEQSLALCLEEMAEAPLWQ